MAGLIELRRAAREIFAEALKSVDAGQALRRAVRLDGSRLSVLETTIDLTHGPSSIYAIALGKAALPMAGALGAILRERLTAGVLTGPLTPGARESAAVSLDALAFPERWRVFNGGHPLPNRQSLAAAEAAFALLRRADEERALVLFLISGGGSAMLEWPREEQTTVEELRAANRILISCGATIREINAVRRAFSAVKGGGLAARAPRAAQLSLIISDTGANEPEAVASGPTFESPDATAEASSVLERYRLEESLPAMIVRAVKRPPEQAAALPTTALRKHFILLDNERALQAAAAAARARGFDVEIAREVSEQAVDEGCAVLLSRLSELHGRTEGSGRAACLLSGGEFSCPVRGAGIGGRNAETALRLAIELDAQAAGGRFPENTVALSAGTDGIDGNSPAAGAMVDTTTARRARLLGLDARQFLEASDAYTFFDALGDAIMTGMTGTNVRDLRIMLTG